MIPLGAGFPLLPAPPPSIAATGSAPCSQNHAGPQKSRFPLHARPTAQREQPDWNSYTCEFLVTHILRQQHAELREELHRLQDLAASAAERPAHPRASIRSASHGRATRVQMALATLAGRLDSDFAEEERLYPRLLDVGMDCTSNPPQPVQPSLHHTAHRHDLEKKRLDRIQTAVRSNPAPRAGTASHELWDRLHRFHRLLLTHFHLEDYVLLPRVTRMEAELFG
jgi:iron-sulfur cluster repair protein YtfE (RIC family)